MKNKINKNTIPNDFSIKLVLIDAFPVLFFGLSGIFLGLILNNFFILYWNNNMHVIWNIKGFMEIYSC